MQIHSYYFKEQSPKRTFEIQKGYIFLVFDLVERKFFCWTISSFLASNKPKEDIPLAQAYKMFVNNFFAIKLRVTVKIFRGPACAKLKATFQSEILELL